jgi:hypothetical protein
VSLCVFRAPLQYIAPDRSAKFTYAQGRAMTTELNGYFDMDGVKNGKFKTN